MIDMIVHRHQLKETLARSIRILTHKPKLAPMSGVPARAARG
jgi:acetyl-CoA carboxylase beta subunit